MGCNGGRGDEYGGMGGWRGGEAERQGWSLTAGDGIGCGMSMGCGGANLRMGGWEDRGCGGMGGWDGRGWGMQDRI